MPEMSLRMSSEPHPSVDDSPELESRGFLLSASLLREKVPSFADYPFNLPAIRDLATLPLHRAVTFIVGENGSGKSTLLEALAVAAGFNAEAARAISASKPALPTPTFTAACGSRAASAVRATVFSSARNRSSTSPLRWTV